MDGTVTDFIQPVLVALAVLLIPACTRFAVHAMNNKLDEGRRIAESNRETLKTATAEEATRVADILEEHRKEFLEKLSAIETQTTKTNGTVQAHTEDILVLKARTDVLMELALKGKPE